MPRMRPPAWLRAYPHSTVDSDLAAAQAGDRAGLDRFAQWCDEGVKRWAPLVGKRMAIPSCDWDSLASTTLQLMLCDRGVMNQQAGPNPSPLLQSFVREVPAPDRANRAEFRAYLYRTLLNVGLRREASERKERERPLTGHEVAATGEPEDGAQGKGRGRPRGQG